MYVGSETYTKHLMLRLCQTRLRHCSINSPCINKDNCIEQKHEGFFQNLMKQQPQLSEETSIGLKTLKT